MSELTDKWKNFRRDMGNLISQLDGSFAKLKAEEKRMEQKRDESYKKGAEDMREAMIAIVSPDIRCGMRSEEVTNMFCTPYFSSILEQNSAINIIDKVNQWKGEKEKLKETDFQVGDEIEYSGYRDGLCHKYIVIKANSDSDVLWLLDLRSFLRIWIYKGESSLKKTGKHFDTINIPEGGAII